MLLDIIPFVITTDDIHIMQNHSHMGGPWPWGGMGWKMTPMGKRMPAFCQPLGIFAILYCCYIIVAKERPSEFWLSSTVVSVTRKFILFLHTHYPFFDTAKINKLLSFVPRDSSWPTLTKGLAYGHKLDIRLHRSKR